MYHALKSLHKAFNKGPLSGLDFWSKSDQFTLGAKKSLHHCFYQPPVFTSYCMGSGNPIDFLEYFELTLPKRQMYMPCLFYKFIYLFIYLFIFGCVGSSLLHTGFLQLRRARATLHCGARASHCSGSSCCGARALEHGLQNTGSVVVAHGLHCSAACGIFPDQGSNPCPLHWQADS